MCASAGRHSNLEFGGAPATPGSSPEGRFEEAKVYFFGPGASGAAPGPESEKSVAFSLPPRASGDERLPEPAPGSTWRLGFGGVTLEGSRKVGPRTSGILPTDSRK